ncbi:ABC transporter permease [Anaerocolumna chitinilytica]|uniref:Efflux ABC transporter permease n=1 Tax=Anaerocolumna chitinilytica TaxID=1727145 RepID=A0A7I8DJL6_9FIRM|nr:ABC transporter permease [Anaerocolumna chitinilytica]BCJ98619.1 efflux ABC transporter permease [Anaerocolumna chitinilytica]
MRNNNIAIVRKITKRTLSSDKRRNFFIIAAITLTTFMIASVFSIGVSYYDSINMHEKRMQGSISQMAFSNPTSEQLEKIYSLDYVKTIGLGAYVAQTKDIPKLDELNIAYVDKTQWKKIFSPTFTNIIGHYAEQENEIMLSRYILNAMGINEPKIGMKIPISFIINGTNEVKTETFTLSCIYTEYAHSRQNGFVAIYSSYAFAKKYDKISTNSTMVNIIFKDSKNINKNIERLKNDLAFTNNQNYTESPAFTNTYGNITNYIALLVIILFLMFTGYLLIYNVMYISISKDVRFYGMLKTLGTTPRQIRHIVIGQILRLCVIGLPVGCIASVAISMLIVPAVISNSGIDTGSVVSFSPIIYIGAVVFSVLTALFGAAAPAKKAANISPVEALKFTAGDIGKTKIPVTTNGKSYKMALLNIFRNRNQATIVMLSLFLGIMIFSLIITIVSSMDIDYRVNSEYNYDFSISSQSAYPDYGLNDDFIKNVKSLNGITESGITTIEFGELIYSEALDKYIDWLSNDNNMTREESIAKLLGCELKGIDSLKLREINKTLSVPIDIKEFESGKIALINIRNGSTDDVKMANCLSDIATFDIKYNDKGDYFHIANGGSISTETNDSFRLGGPEILVSNAFLHQYFPTSHVLSIDLNVKNGYDEQIYNAINDLAVSMDITMISRYAARKAMQDAKTIMMVLGGGVSFILALIGIFNFVNVMSVSIMTRKREFAILESVGMSKKQMRSMLRNEGLGYAIITILCSLTIGNLIIYVLFTLLKNVEKYAQFTYPFIPIIMMYVTISLICFITPKVVYRSISKMSIIDRLRETE